MTIEEIRFLRALAVTATSSEDATEKWKAHSQLMQWFRSDPVAVISAIEAQALVSARPGGLHHQMLYRSIASLPQIPDEAHV